MVFLSGGVARRTPASNYGGTDNLVGRVVTAPSEGVRLATTFATYGKIYETHLWVAVLVNKRANATARLPFKVYERGAGDSRSDARDSDFARLLANPNPVQDPFSFWLWTSSTYDVCGEALWVKIRPRRGAAPDQLWPLHPSNVVLERDDQGVLWYIYRYARDRELRWPSHDIVHFRSYNPNSTLRGLSRLEPLRATLMNEDAIRRAQQAFWKNGARPSVILTHPKELRGPAADRIKTSWQAAHGGIESWSKTAVLEEGMDAKIVQLSSEEMQMIESRKVNREEACAIYDVPPPVVHILDHATFSNITEQMRSMYRDTMAPHLELFESAIDHQLRPDFDPTGSLYGEFLMDEVLRGSFEERSTAYQKGINSGWLKPKEVRVRENLEDAGPAADRLYINGAALPLELAGTAPATQAPTPDPNTGAEGETDGTDASERALVARTIAGRLSRCPTPADVDPTALTRGLADDAAQIVHAHLNAARTRGDDIAVLRRSLNAALTAEPDTTSEGDQP